DYRRAPRREDRRQVRRLEERGFISSISAHTLPLRIPRAPSHRHPKLLTVVRRAQFAETLASRRLNGQSSPTFAEDGDRNTPTRNANVGTALLTSQCPPSFS